MNKRILIVCNTHYQLLVAIHMKLSLYADVCVDCAISDLIPNASTLIERLKVVEIFKNLFFLKAKGKKFKCYEDISKKNVIGNDLLELINNNEYTDYMFANLGGLDISLGRYLVKYCRGIKIFMFEDGLSSYSKIYASEIKYSRNKRYIFKYIKNKIFRNPLGKFIGYYVFFPEGLVWDCPVVKEIPSISHNIDKLRQIVNYVYAYDKLTDNYQEQVIFFEESYFQDGIEVNDVSFVDTLARKYGKNNVFIKTHPRNETNRFKKLGYKTNSDKAIPWEVIALNIELDEKILVTMTSTALLNTCIMRPSTAKLIYDYRKMDLNSNIRLLYTVEVIQNMKRFFSDIIIMED